MGVDEDADSKPWSILNGGEMSRWLQFELRGPICDFTTPLKGGPLMLLCLSRGCCWTGRKYMDARENRGVKM